MVESENKRRLMEIIVKYLTELSEKGAIMSQLSRRVNNIWPKCPFKITRKLLRELDLERQLYFETAGPMGKIYLQGGQPVSVCSAAPLVTDNVKIAPDKLPPPADCVDEDGWPLMPRSLRQGPAGKINKDAAKIPPQEPARFPVSDEQMVRDSSQVDFSAACKIAPDNHSASAMPARIAAVCDHIKDFLIKKNQSYGNSVAEPVRIFSKAAPIEQINVRIDDKLSRLLSGAEYPGDDTELDLIGYLIMKRVLVCDPVPKGVK